MKKNTNTPKSTTDRRLRTEDLSLVTGAAPSLGAPILRNDQWQTTTGYGRLGDGGVRDCD